jgi:hypothetical protein
MAASHCSRQLCRCLSMLQRKFLRVADHLNQSNAISLRIFKGMFRMELLSWAVSVVAVTGRI